MSDPIEGRFGWYRQSSGGNFYMSVRQLMLAEKKNRMLSLLQRKMLMEASKFSPASDCVQSPSKNDFNDGEWLHEFFIQRQIGDVNEMALVDGSVAYYASGYIGRSICRRRKCASCKELLLSEKESGVVVYQSLFPEFMVLFDEAHREGLSAPTELCYATTALAVHAYTVLLEDDEKKRQLLTASNQRGIFTRALIQFVSVSEPAILQRCTQNYENFELIDQSASNYFAKNELKRLNCRKSKAPARMQRTACELSSKSSAKNT